MEDVEGDERMDDVDMAPPTNGLDTNSNFHDYSNNSSNVPVEDLTGQIQQEKVARRFLVWIILMITNIICIIAICLGRRHDSAEEKWAISIVTLSFVVSFASVLCYQFARAVFASGPLELGMAIFIFILWCAGLAIIMNPSNSIAVGYTQIVNGNLYLSSWVAFVSMFWMVGDLLGELYGYKDMTSMISTNLIRSDGTIQGTPRQGKWYALLGASVVVMASSVRVFHSFKCQQKVMWKAPVCKDSKIGIAISVIATAVAMVITLAGCCVSSGHSIVRIAEYIVAMLLVCLWSVGLGFITFGEGPGHSVGNLFFATWCAFLLSAWIIGECFLECKSSGGSKDDAIAEGTTPFEKELQTELPNYASKEDANVDDSPDEQQMNEML